MNENVRQAYIDQTTAQMREWSAKIDVFKAKIAKESAGVRLDYHSKIENWQEKESVLKQKMADLRAAGEEGFESIKTGIQSIWSEMNNIISSIEDNKNEKI